MSRQNVTRLLLSLALCASIQSIGLSNFGLYWAEEEHEVHRIRGADSSGATDLVTAGVSGARDLSIDFSAGHMYWTDMGTGAIKRANLDGSGVTSILAGVGPYPITVDLDVASGHMYWTLDAPGTVADKIQRANLDGSGITDVVTGLSRARGFALDLDGGKMYWTDIGTDKIQRANLDGSGIEDLVLVGPDNSVQYVALDAEGGKMYWTDSTVADGRIRRANLDGSSIEDLIPTGLHSPSTIALDITNGHIYWGDYLGGGLGDSRIRRANLDGTNIVDVVVGLSDVYGLTLNLDGDIPQFLDLSAVPINPVPVPSAALLGVIGFAYSGIRLRRARH